MTLSLVVGILGTTFTGMSLLKGFWESVEFDMQLTIQIKKSSSQK